MTLTLTLTLKIVYLDTTDILQLNYYIQHIGNKKLCWPVVPRRPYKNIWMPISHDNLKKNFSTICYITCVKFSVNMVLHIKL